MIPGLLPTRHALAVLSFLILSAGAVTGATLYGTDGLGNLFTVDVNTGIATIVGTIPPATEIVYDNASGLAWAQLPDGSFQIQPINITTGGTVGPAIGDAAAFNGLAFVGSTLYGTAITNSGGPSKLRILNPSTGGSTLVGPTGVGPISGLAYDGSLMYGIDGGPGPANLYTINLATGAATVIGSTGIQAGSLAFGPDGNLYAGGTGTSAGLLYRINRLNGANTLIGATGFSSVTGLTLVVAGSFAGEYQVRYLTLQYGDGVINFTNTGTLAGTDPSGTICVNVYAFDPAEEMISCCACKVTPNGLSSISARTDIMGNTLTNGVPQSITVKLLATSVGSGTCNPATQPTSGNLARGMRAWATTLHSLSVQGSPAPPPLTGLAETEFAKAGLSPSEFQKLTSYCNFIQLVGSGFGQCKSCTSKVGAQGGAGVH